jgi:hypothetical protein
VISKAKYCVVTGEAGTSKMTVVWAPVGPIMPGVYDITFIQETGRGLKIQRHDVEIALCKKTAQRLIDEIFQDEPQQTKSYGTEIRF